MSWDVSVQRFGKVYSTVEEIPEGESCQVLGSPEFVRQAISHVFSCTNWNDPTWGIYLGQTGSVEFNMGSDCGIDGFMLHVRADESIVDQMVSLLLANGWQGLDCSTGEFLEARAEAREGIRGWIGYVSTLRK